ncbi:MAG: hypothetical protein HZB16_10105 [Armatimonadetes bacterium]|nr:hypothetical protein [Armatimonadota bacterium]
MNALLAQRGFDLSVIDDAEQDALRTLAQQCALGKRIRTPRAAAALALTVASCLMDQGRWPASQQRDAQACLAMLREALPDLYCVAESHVASVARHGVADQAGIRRVVDECAAASFRLAGDVFDAERDLVEAPPSEWFVDKHPGFLPGVPLHAKLDIWRVMARRGLGPQVRYSVIRNNPHFAEIVLVGAGSGEPCPPSVTYSLPLSPPMAPPATPLVHLATPAASAPNWPPAAGVSLAPEGWPAPVLWDPLGRLTDGRGYMPGMGRWLSRVAFEEQELGEHPYGYGLNSPATQTDPSGLSPWADWSREHDLPSPITTVIEVGEGLREMSIEEYARAFETVLAANSAALGFKMLDYRDEPGFTGSKWAWRVFYVDVAFISGYTTCEAVNANKLKPWRKATRIRKYFRWQPRWTTEAGGWKPPHIDLLWRGRQIVIPLNPLRWKWWQK